MPAMTSGFSGMQGVSYHYGGLLTPEEAEEEDQRISQSRAALETEGTLQRRFRQKQSRQKLSRQRTLRQRLYRQGNVPPETVPPAGEPW